MKLKTFTRMNYSVYALIFSTLLAIINLRFYEDKTLTLLLTINLTLSTFVIAYQSYKINLRNYNMSLTNKRCEIYKVIIETLNVVSIEGYLPKEIYVNFRKSKLEARVVFEESDVLQYIEEIHEQLNSFINYQKDRQEEKKNIIRANLSKQLLECDKIFERHLHFSEP